MGLLWMGLKIATDTSENSKDFARCWCWYGEASRRIKEVRNNHRHHIGSLSGICRYDASGLAAFWVGDFLRPPQLLMYIPGC